MVFFETGARRQYRATPNSCQLNTKSPLPGRIHDGIRAPSQSRRTNHMLQAVKERDEHIAISRHRGTGRAMHLNARYPAAVETYADHIRRSYTVLDSVQRPNPYACRERCVFRDTFATECVSTPSDLRWTRRRVPSMHLHGRAGSATRRYNDWLCPARTGSTVTRPGRLSSAASMIDAVDANHLFLMFLLRRSFIDRTRSSSRMLY